MLIRLMSSQVAGILGFNCSDINLEMPIRPIDGGLRGTLYYILFH